MAGSGETTTFSTPACVHAGGASSPPTSKNFFRFFIKLVGGRKKKQENKEKILKFLESNPNPNDGQARKITNNDVEKMTGVSDATAERYLDELEQEGKIKQVGETGHAVYYRLG